jgi:hypothetical protein
MSLTDGIRKLGGRLGLISVVEVDAASKDPAKIATRQVSIKDLATEVKQDEVRILAETPAELAVPFDKVFEAAGLKPPAHGWTVDRLAALLATDQYKGMDRTNVQKAILGLLSTEKVPAEDIVKDAVTRDHAIDAYDGFVHKKMEDRAAAREHRAAEIQGQIKDLEAECARLTGESKSDIDRRREWIDRKIAYEQQMAHALSYLLDHPVISITEPEVRK